MAWRSFPAALLLVMCCSCWLCTSASPESENNNENNNNNNNSKNDNNNNNNTNNTTNTNNNNTNNANTNNNNSSECRSGKAIAVGLHEEVPIWQRVGEECDMGTSSLGCGQDLHFEAHLDHPVLRCLFDSEFAAEAKNVGTLLGEAAMDIDFELSCQRRQRRLYWLFGAEKMSRDSEGEFYLNHFDVQSHVLVCVAAACELSAVGSWIAAPVLAHATWILQMLQQTSSNFQQQQQPQQQQQQPQQQQQQPQKQQQQQHQQKQQQQQQQQQRHLNLKFNLMARHFGVSKGSCLGAGHARLPRRDGFSIRGTQMAQHVRSSYLQSMFSLPELDTFVFVAEQRMPDWTRAPLQTLPLNGSSKNNKNDKNEDNSNRNNNKNDNDQDNSSSNSSNNNNNDNSINSNGNSNSNNNDNNNSNNDNNTSRRFPLAAAAPPSGVAVLLAGQWRFRAGTLESIRRHVVEVHDENGVNDGRTLVFGAFSRAGNVTGKRAHQLLSLAFGTRLQGFTWLKDMPQYLLEKEFADSLPLIQVMGGLGLGPLTSQSTSNLHNLRKSEAVLDLVESYEAARGFRFQWLIFSRLDTYWMARHPALSLLDPNSVYVGFPGCDWHAIVPRAVAPAYFRRYSLVRHNRLLMFPLQGSCRLLRYSLLSSGVRLAMVTKIAELDRCAFNCFSPNSRPRLAALGTEETGSSPIRNEKVSNNRESGKKGRWRHPENARYTAWLAHGLQSGRLRWVRGSGQLVAEVWNIPFSSPALLVVQMQGPNATTAGPARLIRHLHNEDFDELGVMVGPCPISNNNNDDHNNNNNNNNNYNNIEPLLAVSEPLCVL
ncbi:unnamed protein product [Polarella glacialis]|uniref:Uncharacterized protein n=1 Tax=Polarella glacialis TaxID=89957 RepID=A0A813M6Q0_POLGL|nr:unnamed protein product [Polarella glacialis]